MSRAFPWTLGLLGALLAVACSENRTFPERMAYEPADPVALSCVPNLDGRIDAEELEPALGESLSFVVSPAGTERAVDVEGRVEEGRRVWDWSVDDASDQELRITAQPIEDRWYRERFPEGEFVTEGVLPGRLEAVMRKDDRALYVLGFASAEEAPPEGQTLLVYETPVALYRFPMEPGDEWTQASDVMNGTLFGLPFAGRDVYEVRVDGTGRLELPDLSFDQAHRVRLHFTVEPAVGTPFSIQQVSFLFECFGEVARATSRLDEPNENFDVASELRRLSL